jgi:type IV secretory pathway VirB2 component (pilin)
MLTPQGAPQELESIRVAIVIFAVIAVIFGRALLRLALTIAAILILILLASGAVAFFQGVQHVIR